MAVNSGDAKGCLGIAKDLEIGRSLGSECTHALTYRL